MTDHAANERPALLKLFLLSVVMLFLELLLIRWISTEIRIFAYFKNLTLISCFLGMSLGLMLAVRREISLVWSYLTTLVICLAVAVPERLSPGLFSDLSARLGDFNDMATWSSWSGEGTTDARLVALATLVIVFALVAAAFVPFGSLLGRLMNDCSRKIAAYSSNVAGSLIGIWLYSLVAFLELPPQVWFLTALLMGCVLLRGRSLIVGLACTLVVGLALTPPAGSTTVWSPYQKLAHRPLEMPLPDGTHVPLGYLIDVNQTFYQRIVNLDPAYLAAHPGFFPEARNLDYLSYNLVYRLQQRLENVLVVGAGTGNDVA
ncbi:MAG: hypothetical protein WBG67_02655, partial [Thermoanaerobaculia bacterium]